MKRTPPPIDYSTMYVREKKHVENLEELCALLNRKIKNNEMGSVVIERLLRDKIDLFNFENELDAKQKLLTELAKRAKEFELYREEIIAESQRSLAPTMQEVQRCYDALQPGPERERLATLIKTYNQGFDDDYSRAQFFVAASQELENHKTLKN